MWLIFGFTYSAKFAHCMPRELPSIVYMGLNASFWQCWTPLVGLNVLWSGILEAAGRDYLDAPRIKFCKWQDLSDSEVAQDANSWLQYTEGFITFTRFENRRLMGCRTACRNKLCMQGPLLLNPKENFLCPNQHRFCPSIENRMSRLTEKVLVCASRRKPRNVPQEKNLGFSCWFHTIYERDICSGHWSYVGSRIPTLLN